MKELDNRIKRKLCVLGVLVLFGAMAFGTSVTADHTTQIWYRDDTNSDVTLDTEALGFDVGINDDDPRFKLEVAGIGDIGYFGVSSTAGNNGDIFIIDSNSNVGIGVTNPTDKLEIDGNVKLNTGANRYIYLEVADTNRIGYDLTVEAGDGYCTGGSGKDGGHLYLKGGDGDAWGQYTAEGGDVYLYGGAGEGGEGGGIGGNVILAHTGSEIRGNVGIGTVSPGARLHVIGDVKIDSGDLNVDSGTLFVDQSFNRVGIGTSYPTLGKLQIDVAPSAGCSLYIATPMGVAPDNGDINIGGKLFIGEDNIQAAVGRTLYINKDNDVDLIINNGGGDVGIGTTNPSARLHVDPIVIDSTDYYGIKSEGTYNGPSTIANWYGMYVQTPGGAELITNEYALVTEANAGNVGIGSTGPRKAVEVNSATGDNLRLTYLDETGIAANYADFLTKNNALTIQTNGVIDDIELRTENFDNALFIDDDNGGRVGIGTMGPLTKLDVRGGAIFNYDKGDYDFRILGQSDGQLFYVNALANNIGISTSSPGSKLEIQGDTNTASTSSLNIIDQSHKSLLFVRDDGNVGIGTINPDYSLDVYKQSDHSKIRIQSDATKNSELLLTNTVNSGWSIYKPGSSSDLRFGITGGTDRLTIKSDGNVGIGTTNPNQDLHIGDGTTTGNKEIHIEDHDDAYIWLEADEDNDADGEDDNAYIIFSQDDALVQTVIGSVGHAGKDPRNGPYAGTLSNTFLIGTQDSNTNLQLGTNDYVRMTITTDGNVGIGKVNPIYKLDVKAKSDVGEASFTGAGLDDMTSSGTFTGSSPLTYTVEIDDTPLQSAITLANSLKASYNAHIDCAQPPPTDCHDTADTTNDVDANDATDLTSLKALVSEMLTDYDAHESDAELSSGWLYHYAQEASDHTLDSIDAPTNLDECRVRLNDFKVKFNGHDGDYLCHGSESYQVSTPDAYDLPSSITLANSLRASFIGHKTSEVWHRTQDLTPFFEDDADDLESLKNLVYELLIKYDLHEGDAERSSYWAYHWDQEASDHTLESTAPPTNLDDCIDRLNDLKPKFNGHDADHSSHRGDALHHRDTTADAHDMDSFKWSEDGGIWWQDMGVEITGSPQLLNNNVWITFGSTTGHTIGDYWTFTTTVTNPFYLQNAAGTDIFYVGNDGKVGIGTTSPGGSSSKYELEVAGDAWMDSIGLDHEVETKALRTNTKVIKTDYGYDSEYFVQDDDYTLLVVPNDNEEFHVYLPEHSDPAREGKIVNIINGNLYGNGKVLVHQMRGGELITDTLYYEEEPATGEFFYIYSISYQCFYGSSFGWVITDYVVEYGDSTGWLEWIVMFLGAIK
jgi:hypothetical protein